jgi:hypothetical protein
VYGQIHFRHAFLVANALNYRDSLKSKLYNKPALLPAMPWKDNVAPAAPSTLTLDKNSDNNSVALSWTKPSETLDEFDKVNRFVIYRSQNPEIDIENANNILAITYTGENTYADNTPLPDSTYYYAVTSIDRFHNESTMTNTVSNDRVNPTVITQNITRTLSNGAVTISAPEVDNGSSDNWGIGSMRLSKTTFDCSHIGENTVTLIVTDKAGNIDSATAILTIIGVLPEPVISISRTDNTFTALPENTIALGYGAQNLVLTASNSSQGIGTTTYTWSPASGLSDTNSASANFSPASAGTYTLTVEAVNEFGCSSTASVTITVIDARCGNKVLVCKKTENSSNPNKQICISANAVPEHLQYGASLGACNGQPNSVMALEMDNNGSDQNTASVFSAYPNPFTSLITLTFTLATDERRVVLEIYDMNGNKLNRVYQGEAKANKTYSFSVEAGSFQGQFFNARLITRGKVYHFKLVKE